MRGARWWLLALLGVVLGACSTATADEPSRPVAPFETAATVTSPDGSLRMELGLDELGRPRYRVVRSIDGVDEIVIDDSTLGLELTTADGTPVSLSGGATGIELGPVASTTSTVTLPAGKARASSLTTNRATVTFTGFESGLPLRVDVSVDDTGAALRYHLADGTELGDRVRIEWERTSVAVPAEHRAWLQPHDEPTIFTPAYEALWAAETTAGRPGRSTGGFGVPALFASDETWMLVAETAPGDGDAASRFSSVVADGEFFWTLPDPGEGNGVGDPRPVVDLPWVSPWRLAVVGGLDEIVASNHVVHLSPGGDADTSWIRPGRVSWSWWSDHDSSTDAAAMRDFVDLAADMGWEYSLVDANWNTIDDDELAALVDHAERRGVGLFFWFNSGGPHNLVTEQPRDLMTDRDVRRAEFARLAELGAAGVKVDFWHSDKPTQIQLYRDLIADAADFELLVNVHGSTVPRGWRHEFPNFLSSEAVRGAEFYTFDTTYAAAAPRQNTVLPFTRNVVGPMDYTPVLLGDTERRRTRNGHELALSVVFESGLQHFADTPGAYLSQPDVVLELLRDVPVVWDEVRLLDGAPGEFVVLARRHGDVWWIGAINGTDELRDATVSLDELGLDDTEVTGVCDAAGWDGRPGSRADWDDPTQYDLRVGPAEERIALDLAAFGGCLLRLD